MGKWSKPSKYTADYIDSILPEGMKVKRPLPEDVRFDTGTKWLFIDPDLGEYRTTLRGILSVGRSTHPTKRANRANATTYSNPEKANKIIEKRLNTTRSRYSKEEFRQKQIKGNLERFGVEWSSQSQEWKDKVKASNLEKYGVENVMLVEDIKNKGQETSFKNHGVRNGGGSRIALEKIAKSIAENKSSGHSKAEFEVLNYIKNELGITGAESGYFGGNEPIQIDIKIPSKKIAIEYNGMYWHSEANELIYPTYHLRKTKIAQQKGYKLIHIFSKEWKDRNYQVKSFLKSALNVNSIKINARNCVIKEISSESANNFLEKYHILGKANNIKRAYGLFYKEELLSVVSLGMHHRGLSELILTRYCCKENTTIRGGLSKITAHIKTQIKDPIYTWIDLRWSSGESWLKHGWELVHQTRPDYFYYNIKTHDIISKQSRKKDLVNTPAHMTERQHAWEDNLRRIWDCGKLKLRLS